jgi:hypothetical protein
MLALERGERSSEVDMAQEHERVHPRTSMFVLATMAAPTVSGPVKIRNMSLGGALIEGDALPRIGEQLRLQRGELAVSGRIVWRNEGKAGLCFEHEVEVSRWLPTGSGGQQQVDLTFQELKTSPINPAPPAATRVEPSPVGPEDLLNVAEALDALADALAEDARVVADHSAKLQSLDMASQLLRRFAASARG